MVGKLLMRGMLAGLLAGLLAFTFAKAIGEPEVNQAIAFEAHLHAMQGDAPEPELVSRETQSGLGLLTGVVAYGTAFGGILALVFAFLHGRVANVNARSLSAWLALGSFVALVLVPTLKYPANPPSIGDPDTIGYRTGLYFLTIALSVTTMVLSVKVRGFMARRLGPWNATLVAAILFVAALTLILGALPDINEVPIGFPATLLWKFRVTAVGLQIAIWATIGVVFGELVERMSEAPRGRLRRNGLKLPA